MSAPLRNQLDSLDAAWEPIDDKAPAIEVEVEFSSPKTTITTSIVKVASDSTRPECASVVLIPPFRSPARDLFPGSEIEAVWLAMKDQAWDSLAFIGTDACDLQGPLELAMALAELGCSQRERVYVVIDARAATLPSHIFDIGLVQGYVKMGARALVVLSPLSTNPVGLPIAKAADAIVACVATGHSTIRAAKDVIERVGRRRILGAIMVRDARRAEPPPKTTLSPWERDAP